MHLQLVLMCRHTDDMIKRLENAGLGFFVKATQSQEKLGMVESISVQFSIFDFLE